MLSGSPNLGILLLDASGSGALNHAGNGSVVVSNGDLVIDSSSSSAGISTGNGNVSANNVYLTGKIVTAGNGRVIGTLHPGSTPEADPLAALPAPTAPATVFHNTLITGGAVTLKPGTYVGGITIVGNATVTLNAGLYYLEGGLNVSGNSKITGAGVTIYNASGAISIFGNTTVTLSAPTSGTYQGVVIFQNRTSTAPITISSASFKLTGEVYAPDATLNITGNATETIAGNGTTIPGALVVRDLSISGNSSLDVDANSGGLTGDLSITKTDNVSGVYSAGGSITYTVTVSNSGPSAAIGATVTDLLPAAITSDSFSITGTTGGAVDVTNPSGGSGNISDTVDLPSGSSITYKVVASISSSATGELSNTATVTAPASFTDTNPANNSATDTDNAGADLAVSEFQDNDGGSSSAGGATAAEGGVLSSGTIQYTIVVTNNGPSPVTGATVQDDFPSDITSDTFTVSASSGASDTTNPGGVSTSGVNNIDDSVNLAKGATITYTVTANISATASGTLSDTASISAPSGVTDPNLSNNSATDTDSFTSLTAITGGNGSTNWSGYDIYPGGSTTVTAVGGTWVLPSVTLNGTPAKNSAVAFWVGIDGAGWADSSSNSVEQIGVVYGLIPGTTSTFGYYTWLEFNGDSGSPYAGITPLNGNFGLSSSYFNPQPGDTISASVTYLPGSSTSTYSAFQFKLTDTPAGGGPAVTFGITTPEILDTTSFVPVRGTGEWIAEATSFNFTIPTSIVALANFGTLTFTGCWAAAGGVTGPITAFPNQIITMGAVNSSWTGGGSTTTSGITNSTTTGFGEGGAASSSFSTTFTGYIPSSSSNIPGNLVPAASVGGGASSNNAALPNAAAGGSPAAGAAAGGTRFFDANATTFSGSPSDVFPFGIVSQPGLVAAPADLDSAAVDLWFDGWNGDSLRSASLENGAMANLADPIVASPATASANGNLASGSFATRVPSGVSGDSLETETDGADDLNFFDAAIGMVQDFDKPAAPTFPDQKRSDRHVSANSFERVDCDPLHPGNRPDG